jgi:hypothetical protein
MREDGMAPTEAFETNFWKDANLRKVWDDIVPGEPRKTVPYTLTSRALPWFESYVGRHRSSQMPLRNACLVTFNEGTVMIGFMESAV